MFVVPWRSSGNADGTGSFQCQPHERVGAVQSIEVVARGDDLLELAPGNRDAGHDGTDAARFLVEVPDDLPARRLLRVAPAVLREDRNPRAEERHLVRRDD